MRAITESAASRSTRTRSAPVPLRVPANTSSPGCLATGSGSPVMVAWSTSLAPSQHPSVGADALAGPDQDDVADARARRSPRVSSRRRRSSRVAVVGRQIEQAAHRVGGAGGGQRLQRAGGGEDDDQQGAVHDLPDRGRAERGDDHQQVDVQGLVPQRPQPASAGSQPPVT